MDGTQLEAWASLKSFRPRQGPAGPPPDDPGNPTVDFHGERRRNDTHQSTTDPQARLYRKGPGREAATSMLAANAPPGSTVGADKGYDVARFVGEVRALDLTPHIARKAPYSAIDVRTTCHPGYPVSQRKRKLVEQVFGWMKTVGGLRKLRHRGRMLVDWIVTFAAAAYNLVRLRNLVATCP